MLRSSPLCVGFFVPLSSAESFLLSILGALSSAEFIAFSASTTMIRFCEEKINVNTNDCKSNLWRRYFQWWKRALDPSEDKWFYWLFTGHTERNLWPKNYFMDDKVLKMKISFSWLPCGFSWCWKLLKNYKSTLENFRKLLLPLFLSHRLETADCNKFSLRCLVIEKFFIIISLVQVSLLKILAENFFHRNSCEIFFNFLLFMTNNRMNPDCCW